MKKEIMLTLAISMAVVPSATAAFAAQDTGTKQVVESKFTTVARSMPLEISGKVDKISEGEMTVSTKDGKVYQVPLWNLSKSEGFSELGLKVGTEVSLKSILPDFSNVKMVSTLTPLDMKVTPLDGKTLSAATVKLSALGAIDASKLLKGGIANLNITPGIKAAGHVDIKSIKVEQGTSVSVPALTVSATSVPALSFPVATLTAVEAPLPDITKIQPGTLKVVENAKAINITTVTPAEGSFTLSALGEGNEIFLAGEIAANGKIVKLVN